MAKTSWIMFVFTCLTFETTVVTEVPAKCMECLQSRACHPPDCFCCRDELHLSNITLSQIPQIVFFTFDDAVTPQASGFYYQLFHESRKNPNDCPITMTLFISHDNTKYGLVTEFYRKGMEIASHSVTHSTMNGSNFFDEAKTQKENLAKLAGIPIDEITGWRSPFLKPAGDLQPDALKKLGYTYDATLTFSKRSYREKPPGPFTLDFGYPYECQVKPCPKHKHPGFWEVPVVSLLDYKQAYDCVYVDGCMNAPPNEDSAYQFLWDNFHSYYTTTRMPFGINMHPSWFYYPDRLKAMDRFIQKLVSLNDVYIVSANRMLEWLKRPTPLQDLHSFSPWACDGSEKVYQTGPRLVKTNLPPPPPRSFISWTNSPPIQSITPAPPASQRRFTQTRLFSPPDTYANESTRFIPQTPQKHLFTLDLSQDFRRDNSPVPSGAWNTRKTSVPWRISVDPYMRVRMRISDPPPPVIPPATRLSQQERLDQHEERMRQRQIYEESQRRQELLEQRLRQQRHQELFEQQRQEELAEKQRLEALRRQAAETALQQGTQRILWKPTALSQDVPAETPKTADTRSQPTKIHQETVKLWPHLSQIFRVPDHHTRQPDVSANNIQRERFNVRRVVTPNNNVINIHNSGNAGNAVVPEVTPAPIPTQTRALHTESPRQIWYTNMRSRFGPITNGPRFTRGGSNRRPGFVVTTPPPRVSVAPHIIPAIRSTRTQVRNDTVDQIRERDERIRQQIIDSRRRRVNTDFQNHINSEVNIERPSLIVRERTVNDIPPPSMGIYPRNVLHPSVAQQLAWNSFIRQMLGQP